MRGLSSNNVKPRSPEIKKVIINKSKFCHCREIKDMIKEQVLLNFNKKRGHDISINNDMSPNL